MYAVRSTVAERPDHVARTGIWEIMWAESSRLGKQCGDDMQKQTRESSNDIEHCQAIRHGDNEHGKDMRQHTSFAYISSCLTMLHASPCSDIT